MGHRKRYQNEEYRPIVTMLEKHERELAENRSGGHYKMLHCNSIWEVVREIDRGRINSILWSLSKELSPDDLDGLADLRHRYPAFRLIGYRDNNTVTNDDTMLELGKYEMEKIIDANNYLDWQNMREWQHKGSNASIRIISLQYLSDDLKKMTSDNRRFFNLIFSKGSRINSVMELASHLNTNSSTLNTRFRRAGLPSPKEYLVYSKLTGVALLMAIDGLSPAKAAIQRGYSSPQMFYKHLKDWMKLTTAGFEQQYKGERMLEHFRQHLLLSYMDILRGFRPLRPKRNPRKKRGRT